MQASIVASRIASADAADIVKLPASAVSVVDASPAARARALGASAPSASARGPIVEELDDVSDGEEAGEAEAHEEEEIEVGIDVVASGDETETEGAAQPPRASAPYRDEDTGCAIHEFEQATHSRKACPCHAFVKNMYSAKCAACVCDVCGVLASECPKWANHCWRGADTKTAADGRKAALLDRRADPPIRRARAVQTSGLAQREQFAQRFGGLVQALWEKPQAHHFYHPVDTHAPGLEHYLEVVTSPIDLSTIRQRLREARYENLRELEEDVDRVFDNALKYNDATYMPEVDRPVFAGAFVAAQRMQEESRLLFLKASRQHEVVGHLSPGPRKPKRKYAKATPAGTLVRFRAPAASPPVREDAAPPSSTMRNLVNAADVVLRAFESAETLAEAPAPSAAEARDAADSLASLAAPADGGEAARAPMPPPAVAPTLRHAPASASWRASRRPAVAPPPSPAPQARPREPVQPSPASSESRRFGHTRTWHTRTDALAGAPAPVPAPPPPTPVAPRRPLPPPPAPGVRRNATPPRPLPSPPRRRERSPERRRVRRDRSPDRCRSRSSDRRRPTGFDVLPTRQDNLSEYLHMMIKNLLGDVGNALRITGDTRFRLEATYIAWKAGRIDASEANRDLERLVDAPTIAFVEASARGGR
jgi:hypothetical protein